MGIINSMKKAIAGTSAWLRGKAIPQPLPADATLPDHVTAATPPEPDTSRYRFVSVPMHPIEDALMRKLMGVGYMPGPARTHNIGNNAMKREADRMAEWHGLNNKQRRRLRTKIKRRAEELRTGVAPLSPSVREGMRRMVGEVGA